MINDSRKIVRKFIAGLLQGALVGDGLPAQRVYDSQVGDFEGQSPVVVIASKGTDTDDITFVGTKPNYEFFVHVFVLYSSEDGVWTESNAEDALDDIEQIIRGVLARNKTATGIYESITSAGPSQTGSVEIGGVEYRTETYTLRTE